MDMNLLVCTSDSNVTNVSRKLCCAIYKREIDKKKKLNEKNKKKFK